MNFLNDYPQVRKYLYLVQWVLGGIVTVLGAYFVLAGYAVEDLPKWYVVGNGILPVLWTYLGLQAGANTPSNAAPPPYQGQRGATNIFYAVGVGLLLLAFVLLVTTLLKVFVVDIPVLIVIAVIGAVALFVSGAGPHLRR